jgi:integrase/recombinase XerC
VVDSRSRLLSVVQPRADDGEQSGAEPVLEPGLADVVALQRREAAEISGDDEESLFLDTLAETSGPGIRSAWPRPRWRG